TAPDPAGLTPAQQLQVISERAHEMVVRLYACVRDEILPGLVTHGIRVLPLDQLDATQRATLGRLFRNDVLPALTPLAIDSARPFPLRSSLSINLALLLAPAEGEDQPRLAVVQVPSRLPRLVRPPGSDGTSYALLEDVVRSELGDLFPGQ